VVLLVVLLPPLALQRLELSLVPCQSTSQRVPPRHQHVQAHPEDVARHALALGSTTNPEEEPQDSTELAALVTNVVLASHQRGQHHVRRGLISHHPGLQVGRCNRVSAGGGDEAAGLDEEPGPVGAGEGLFEEADGGVVGGVSFTKGGLGHLSLLVSQGRIGAGVKEKTDHGTCI